jgi:crotonobetainyl-CoA:carnitine CoA-transferase CaiB-like acyl-CoA transferase
MTAAGPDTIQTQITEVEADIAALQAKLRHLRSQAADLTSQPHQARPPLDGIRIVDLTWAVFGPLSTQILADMGAEVIKVERIAGGDLGRQSGSFYAANRNKQSIAVNLQASAGRELVLQLCETAHIFVQNFRPGAIQRLGLDYDAVQQRNPHIVYCSLSGFGEQGPYRTRGGQDLIVQGMAGLMSLAGWPDGPPTSTGFYTSDVTGALYNAVAMLLGLYVQQQQGIGQKIDLALFDCSVAIQGFPLTWYVNRLGEPPQKAGSGHWTRSPMYGTFDTQDHPITLVAGFVDEWWQRLTAIPALQSLADDRRFATMASRRQHREALHESLTERLKTKTRAEWIQIFAAQRILCGPVYTYDELLADPQFRHNAMIKDVPQVDGVPMHVVDTPIRLTKTPAKLRSAPPPLGHHTDAVLDALGYDAESIAQLRQQGVIG